MNHDLVVEICLVIIALSMGAIGVAAVVFMKRLGPLIEALDKLIRDSERVLHSLQATAEEVQRITQHAHNLEQRVSKVLNPLVGHAEHPMRALGGVAAAVRAGVGALFMGRNGTSGTHAAPTETARRS
jgi:ABC-type transporter Mla subunit MlaD